MNLQELHPFRLDDAVKFHDELNPLLWWGDNLQPRVRRALLKIAADFIEYLGVDKLKVVDITISGSNAAYSYTRHSDIDLHIVVDMKNLNPDGIYRELFGTKKALYNEGHKITIKNIPVECYVQDSDEGAVSLGEYSVQNGEWIKFPTKSPARIDHRDARLKYEKLQHIIGHAINTGDSALIDALLRKIRRYRQSGLDRGGEFSPENLSFKALRSSGVIDRLYKLRDRLRGRDLSIESENIDERAQPHRTPTVEEIAQEHGVSIERVNRELKRGIRVEREHTTSDAHASRIARDHLGERIDYYTVLNRVGLEERSGRRAWLVTWWRDDQTAHQDWFANEELAQQYRDSIESSGWDTTPMPVEGTPPSSATIYTKMPTNEASGYIPAPHQKNDPRWKTALSVDVNPNSIRDNARRLGSRIARDGRPPLLMRRK